MMADYEDDTHFCLKCHSTVIGLDSYVAHRKAGCGKSLDLPKSPLPSQLLPPDESFGLKADDFFSSLELQSSSKKLPVPSSSSTGKTFNGILTRSKTTAAIQAKDNVTHHNQEIPQSKSGKNVWIGGHQLLKLGYGDNQSKLIKAVDNLERRKEDLPNLGVYEEDSEVESDSDDYEDEESSDEETVDAPPRNHTGGKWKPSSPVQFSDWNVPSPSYTGGKWKPSNKRNSPPPSHTKGKWKPQSDLLSPNKDGYDYNPPPTFTGSKWSSSKAQIPPSSHTKGKWKPEDVDETKQKTVSKKAKDSTYPTGGKWKPIDPTYTKGKWIPPSQEVAKKTVSKITDDSPFRKSSGTVQYWCRPCNRRLASKIVYERHLKSELHFKRTLHDKEFDDNNLGVITEKRQNKKKITNLISINIDEDEKSDKTNKRKRKKIYSKCLVCNSKVNNNMIGKHLISHYHCRKGDITSDLAREMVLKNIWEVVLQSPFQCGICRFYFNHHADFLEHWVSPHHRRAEETVKGYYLCSLCEFRHDDSGVMHSHLTSEEHEEVVSVINRSVPIVIKKIHPVKCGDCQEEFLLNIALKKHREVRKHNLDGFLSSVDKNFACARCRRVFRSNVSLKRHRKSVHKEQIYVCTVCDKEFDDGESAKAHRKSLEHRHATKNKDQGSKEQKCEFCPKVLEDFLKMKMHLKNSHPQFCPKCPQCGASFAISQELSVHLRTKSCSYKNEDSFKDPANSCDKCPFTSSSTSELLYHQVLHTEPLVIPPGNDEGKKKPLRHYKCPLCQKFFPKSSLQPHLRIHTKERPFICAICKKSFARKNNWLFHLKNHEKKRTKTDQLRQGGEGTTKIRPFLCSTCGASFQRKSILKQHMTTHTGKTCRCPESGCAFSARTVGELKIHFQTHSDAKNFACDICEYRGKTKAQLNRHSTVHEDGKKHRCDKCAFSARTVSHLKRHKRLHTGSKPYSCPHCDYRCNSLENLRKHVLSTGKHRGKRIYECKFCAGNQFGTNFAKDFKAHLVSDHPQVFSSGPEAASYIAGIYDAQEDAIAPSTSNLDENAGNCPKPKVIILQKPCTLVRDPVVAASTSKDSQEEIFPMFIVSKDETGSVDNLTETWSLVGSYDVEEESGALVPFPIGDGEVLFQDHNFQ